MVPPLETAKAQSLAEAVKVSPVPGSVYLFDAYLPLEWSTQPVAHGGILQSLVISTARTYFQTQHPTLNQPDTITLQCQFLQPARNGPTRLVVTTLQLGSRVSVIQVALQNPAAAVDTFNTCLLALVTQGNLSIERGLTLETKNVARLDKRELPDQDSECQKLVYPSWVTDYAPSMLKVAVYRVERGNGARSRNEMGRSTTEMWCEFVDGSGWDMLSLGFLVDLAPAIPIEYADHTVPDLQYIRYPTLVMATEVKRDPKECKRLFMIAQTEEIRNGRFDTNITVMNEEGELIVTSKHVSLVNSRLSSERTQSLFKL